MPIRGTKPGANTTTKQRSVHEWVEVPNVPHDGRHLPPRRCNGKAWSAATKRKWEAIRTMPHAALWTDSEWEFALDTIELVALFYSGNTKVAGEIRNREKVLGTTHEYRRDQRIRYVEPKPVAVAEVRDIDDYRDL